MKNILICAILLLTFSLASAKDSQVLLCDNVDILEHVKQNIQNQYSEAVITIKDVKELERNTAITPPVVLCSANIEVMDMKILHKIHIEYHLEILEENRTI